MKFNWIDKQLYKGEGRHQSFYFALLFALIGLCCWFTFGGSHVVWGVLSKVLSL